MEQKFFAFCSFVGHEIAMLLNRTTAAKLKGELEAFLERTAPPVEQTIDEVKGAADTAEKLAGWLPGVGADVKQADQLVDGVDKTVDGAVASVEGALAPSAPAAPLGGVLPPQAAPLSAQGPQSAVAPATLGFISASPVVAPTQPDPNSINGPGQPSADSALGQGAPL